MKSKFTSIQVLLAAIIVMISATSTRAQNLQHDWTETGAGTITNLQNMTVLENGDCYVAEDTRDEPGSHGFNIVKYDDDGFVWRRAYVPDWKGEHVKPIATAYNAGAIFVLGNMNDVEVRIIKFSAVDGSKLREDPHGGIFTHSSRGIVADPVGTGVIVTYMTRYTDDSYFGHFQHRMFTIKYDADLNEVWEFPVGQSLGLLDYTQNPTPTPRAIAADSDGNTYITGVLDVEIGPPGPPYLTGAASAFTLKYNSLGELQWLHKITEPSITNYGYDNDYDATGTYMVHQHASSHYDDGPPLLFGSTVLTKRNLDGTTWTRTRPSTVRDLEWRDVAGTSVQKDVLVVDKITSSAYIAYDDMSVSSVALEKYDAEGDLQWPTQHISIGESTSVESVILDKSRNVVVGVNNDVLGNYSIYVFAPSGHFIDNIDVPGMVLKQLVVDDHNRIHAIGTISGSTTSHFVSRFSYEPTTGSIPVLVRGIGKFEADLFAFDPGECWTGPFINWTCPTPPYCVNPKEMKASLLFQGKTVWESTFDKPLDTTFPESKDFRTFSLKVNDGQMFQEVLLVDDKLVKNGVTQLSFKTNSINESVDLNIKTDGAQIPVTISLLNAQRKVLWKEQFTAPFQKQISEKFNEPVASISINGPEDQISITYYPNPSNGAFTVELDPKQSLPVELSVYDMQGFRIHQQMLKEQKSAVSLSGKKPGLYVLQIKNGVTEIRELIQIK